MKRVLSVFLSIACIISMLVIAVPLSVTAEAVAPVGYSDALVEAKDGLASLNDIKNGLIVDVTEYKITDAAGLEKVAHIANGTNGETINNFSGYTLYLANDIDLTDVAHEPIGINVAATTGEAWKGNEPNPSFRGTFDGQGHAIRNMTVVGDGSNYGQFGLFGRLAVATIRNLIIDSSCSITGSFPGGAQVGFVAGYGYWSVVLRNVSVRGTMNITAGTYIGGLVGRVAGGGNVPLNNCDFTGTMSVSADHVGALVGSAGWNGSGVLSFTSCRMAGTLTNSARTGGIIGLFQGNVPTINFSNSIVNGSVSGNADLTGGFLGDASANAGYALTFTDCYIYGTVSNNRPFVGKFTNAPGTFSINGAAASPAAGSGAAYGGFTAGDDPTIPVEPGERELVGYSATLIEIKDGLDALNDVKNGLLDGIKQYKITDAAGLEKVAHIANGTNGETLNNFSGYTLYLANDIDMTDVIHEPIGVVVTDGVFGNAWVATNEQNPSFRGTFDGQGHRITNWIVNDNGTKYNQVGLFGQLAFATIKNLIIDESCSITYLHDGGTQVSFIAAYAYGGATLTNVSVRGSIPEAQSTYMGGMIARTHGATGASMLFTNCDVRGTINHSGGGCHEGGFVGSTAWNWKDGGELRFTNCRNAADITGNGHLGGFISIISGCMKAYFTNCVNNGAIVNSDAGNTSITGGFVSDTQSGGLFLTFIDCENYGTSANRPFVGKIANALNEGTSGLKINGTNFETPINAGTAGTAFGSFSVGEDTTLDTYDFYGIKTIGTQSKLNGDGTYAVRMLLGLETLDHDVAGFEITVTGDGVDGSKNWDRSTNVAYVAIYENVAGTPTERDAEYFGVNYLCAMTVVNISTSTYGALTFTVRPYVDNNGERVYASTLTVTYNDGVYVD